MWPRDWKDWLGVIAKEFHAQPSEVMKFTIDDLLFWIDRHEFLRKAQA